MQTKISLLTLRNRHVRVLLIIITSHIIHLVKIYHFAIQCKATAVHEKASLDLWGANILHEIELLQNVKTCACWSLQSLHCTIFPLMEDFYCRSILFENGTLCSIFAQMDGLLKIYNTGGCIFCKYFAPRDNIREITWQEKSFQLGFYEII